MKKQKKNNIIIFQIKIKDKKINIIIPLKILFINIKVCCLFMIMVKVICEECLYTGKKVEFVKNSDYCKECVCDHPMCPKCKSAYHTVTITE